VSKIVSIAATISVIAFATACGGPAVPSEVDTTQAALSTCLSNKLRPWAATASGDKSGNAPAKAIDGVSTSRWESPWSDPQWLQVDLGAQVALNRVVIKWATRATAKDYRIEISADGNNFNTLLTKTNMPAGTDRVDDWSTATGLAAGVGRYVRVYGTGRNTSYGYSIGELDLYGDTNATCGATTCIDVVPALGFTCSSQEGANFGPNKAADGNMTTRWSSQFTDDEWLQLDLGSGKLVNRVVIDWQNSSAKTYDLAVSADGTTYTTVASKANMPAGAHTDELSIPPSAVRYVRMNGIKRNTAYGYSIFEMKLFGSDDLSCGTANLLNGPWTFVTSDLTPSDVYTITGNTIDFQYSNVSFTFSDTGPFNGIVFAQPAPVVQGSRYRLALDIVGWDGMPVIFAATMSGAAAPVVTPDNVITGSGQITMDFDVTSPPGATPVVELTSHPVLGGGREGGWGVGIEDHTVSARLTPLP
jgi:hypothetical protein